MVNKNNWRKALSNLPREDYNNLNSFLNEYERGLDIGLPTIPPPVHSKSNPKMDLKSKIKMGQTINKWHKAGYLMGPYPKDHPIAKTCRINPVFCVPKPDGSVRPVVNYSKQINGQSLNDILRPDWCTVEYIQLKEIVFTIQQMGVGAMIWAKDLKDGYFNIKIRPEQCKSIAFVFAGLLFIPMVLVFGLSSAPLIFTIFMWYAVSAIRFTDRDLMWMSVHKSSFHRKYFQTEADIHFDNDLVFFPLVMYYLDDIFGVQIPSKVDRQYKLAGETLKFLGLSAKEAKDRPPNTTQLLLGLEYDTIAQEVRIPEYKVIKYKEYAESLMRKSQVTKRELFSLTGKARYASIQCKPLSSFARGVEVHGHRLNNWSLRINMTNRLKKDIRLIIEGMEHNIDRGISFNFILKPRDQFDLIAYTDATTKSAGIGGFVEIKNAPFFQVHWSEVSESKKYDIQWKELVAIAVLIECNVNLFRGKCVNIWSDNEPIIWMLIKWHAPLHRKDLQHILRRIAKLCIFNNIIPWWDYIEGPKNVTADRLSRFMPNPFEFAKIKPGKNQSLEARTALQQCLDLVA